MRLQLEYIVLGLRIFFPLRVVPVVVVDAPVCVPLFMGAVPLGLEASVGFFDIKSLLLI
jgi:hypothetical protein